jgi:hypothetical protein
LIYFENGTCKCPDASVADTETISGTLYTVVEDSTIAGEIANGNVNLCTTLFTDMSELFLNNGLKGIWIVSTSLKNPSTWEGSNNNFFYLLEAAISLFKCVAS